MDIVVTIPKSRMAQVEAEEKQVAELIADGGTANFFWSLGRRKPRSLDVKDRCFFVWDSAVRAYHSVVGFGKDTQCDTTGIFYPGFCVILAPEIHNIDPCPMRGFQGFRYFNWREYRESCWGHRGNPAVGSVTGGRTRHQGDNRLGA